MSSNCYRTILYGVCLIGVAMLAACAVSPAPKVRCDTELRAINPPPRQLP
jgi:hypothetical protein